MKCRKCGYENDFLKKCPFHQPQSEIDAICKDRDKKEAESKGTKNTEQPLQPDSASDVTIPIPVTGKMVFRFGTPTPRRLT